ncbi:SemiSWEET transporter [Danxiaibacter flavus]|uniref:SemiSWEET transporter n=1 Tax=Danxiaibacter flavus TaxID=3049108 RepID=A0ABV3ZK76_9BACT|nr:SemiSWEET transporter [Chitinophagaceae bacterium DXS]
MDIAGSITGLTGIAAGVCTSVSLLPQLFKMLREKKADDISFVTLAILVTGLLLWVIYGVMKKDYPIVVTNSFSALVNIAVMVCTIIYKRKNQ